ncbi:MAG: ABC transporter permease [Firmicutes bacterium]|nr:ABC transporter permease [Bacillota bacterium]
MGVVRFLVKRVVSIIITTAAIIAVGYSLMRLAPGSYFSSTTIGSQMGQLAVQNPRLAEQYEHMFEARYGLNEPMWKQIFGYIWHLFTFNFGNSFENPSAPIITQLRSAFPISFELAFGAVLLAVLVGIPLGVLAALKRNTWIDQMLTTLSLMGNAVPSFVLAVFMVLLFGVWWQGVLPINGWGQWQDAVLPIIALGLGNVGSITRYMRSSLIEALRQDHIRTAEAKGVKYWPIIFKHAMRNSMTALITVVGPMFAFSVVNTIFVEQIFSIPGMGSLMAPAFQADDYPLAMAEIYILCLLVMVMNLLVDLGYAVFDPRVKLE